MAREPLSEAVCFRLLRSIICRNWQSSYPQDIEKAKKLLKEAGYPDGFEMTITVPNNYQQHIDTAQVLAEQLKQVGIQAEIQLMEWDSWLSDVYADRKFQSTVVGVDAAYLSGSCSFGEILFRIR